MISTKIHFMFKLSTEPVRTDKISPIFSNNKLLLFLKRVLCLNVPGITIEN